MKNFLYTTILFLSVISCSNNDENETLYPKNQPVLVSENYQSGNIRELYQNGKLKYDYIYTYTYQGPNGLLSKRQDNSNPTSYYRTFLYNSDLTLKSFDNYNNGTTQRYVFTYNNGFINVKIYTLPNVATILNQYNFTVQNGLITALNGVSPTIFTQTYGYDNKGNISNVNSSNYTFSATYDNKPSVVALKLIGMFGDNYKLSAVLTSAIDYEQLNNNVLTESSIFSTTSYYYSYEYQYAKTNYPIKKTDKNSSYFTTYNYTY